MIALFFLASLGSQELLPDRLLPAATQRLAANAELAEAGRALRFTTREAGRARSDATASWTNTSIIESGDRLRLFFDVRKLEPADRYNLRASLKVGRLLDTVFPCAGDTWMHYAFDLVADRRYEPGSLPVTVAFGQGPQVFEIAGLRLTKQPPLPGVDLASGEKVEPIGNPTRYTAYFDNAAGGGSAQPMPDGVIRITTNGNSGSIFNAALSWLIDRRLARNDTMHLSFMARRVSGLANVRAQAIVERNGGNFSKSVNVQLPVSGTEWQRIQVPFRMDDDYAPGGAAMRFQFGAGPQVFEIANVTLLHFGTRATPQQLPIESTYIGRNDPALAAEAEARIDEFRKAPIVVHVTDADGNPVAGARVAVQQLSHAFRYGSAVTAAGIMGSAADDDQYRARIESHFNTTVLENDLKWPFWEANTSFPQARTRSAIEWLAARGIHVRGHNLIWPSWNNSPADLRTLSADALRTRITNRFRTALTDPGLNGRLYHWDVQNEPFDNFDVQGRIPGIDGVAASNGVLGNNEAVRWFQLARQFDPQTKLFLNDYALFEGGDPDNLHARYTLAYLKFLLDNGAPVDGFGFQGHFGTPAPLTVASQVVDRFANAFDGDFAVTEFDINTPDETMQADYTREFTRWVFSHPRFTDFLMWGFWERRHWLPAGAMYRADWSSKPNAIEWNNLWFRDWWSDLSGETDADGLFVARGFKGAYQITVVANGQDSLIVADLPEGGDVEFVVD